MNLIGNIVRNKKGVRGRFKLMSHRNWISYSVYAHSLNSQNNYDGGGSRGGGGTLV